MVNYKTDVHLAASPKRDPILIVIAAISQLIRSKAYTSGVSGFFD